ncbi:gastric inhibitory polypeptide [Tiliqua scincoides]|uniref:gastric inhibitory polypeptide n=1 Tax=Tiliqua scincoides TaxID=71010 RepID=UPI0034623CEA
MMPFRVLALLMFSLSVVLMEENSTRANAKNPRILQKKYSEGTLASDYSRTLDNMLKKNFVEWLLNRRENTIDNRLDPSKREAERPALGTSSQSPEGRSLEAKDFLTWLLQNMRKQSLALPKDSADWKDILRQEVLAWLISADLCRPM